MSSAAVFPREVSSTQNVVVGLVAAAGAVVVVTTVALAMFASMTPAGSALTLASFATSVAALGASKFVGVGVAALGVALFISAVAAIASDVLQIKRQKSECSKFFLALAGEIGVDNRLTSSISDFEYILGPQRALATLRIEGDTCALELGLRLEAHPIDAHHLFSRTLTVSLDRRHTRADKSKAFAMDTNFQACGCPPLTIEGTSTVFQCKNRIVQFYNQHLSTDEM